MLIVFRPSPSSPQRANPPSWMDCSLGKSESSFNPFNHSQTQPNEHNGMQYYQVWLIVVEEDLWIQLNPPIKPISEKDGALQKPYSPISMDWREGRLLNSSLVTDQNVHLPIINVFSDWNLFGENSDTSEESKRLIQRSFTSNGIEFSWARFLTT